MLPPASLAIGELVSQSGFDRRTIVYYIQQGLLPKVGRRGPNTRYPAEYLSRLKFIKLVKELQDRGQLPTVTLADIARVLGSIPPDRLRELAASGAEGAGSLPGHEIAAILALLTAPADAVGPVPAGITATQAALPPRAQSPDAVPGPHARTPSAPPPEGDSLPAHRRSYGLADASIRQRFHRSPEPVTGPPAVPNSPPIVADPVRGESAMPGPSLQDDDLGALLRELELRPTLNQRRLPPGAPEQWTEVPITSRIYLSVRGLSADDAPLAEGVGRILKRALRGR